MKIEELMVSMVVQAIKALYNQDVDPASVQLQKTKKEFQGHFTVVVFPFVKISRKSPEMTASELGVWLQKNMPAVSSYNVIKGFLNIVISIPVWLKVLTDINSDDKYGYTQVTDESPLVMIEYSSPNTNKPL
ncbi:MAG: arginine--tRNA ligase, partial [Bacteroidaceae bacterium]|nr:arginine--tRNA ligase [Bacteroidaceae bacterium]